MLLVVPALLAAPHQARAQTVATSFEQLRTLVKPGDTLHITETNGRKISGKLGELSTLSIELVAKARLSEGDVRQIVLERRDSLMNGTLIGLAVGAGPFLLARLKLRGTEAEINAAVATVIGGAIGAAVGAAIDALKTKRTVYITPRL